MSDADPLASAVWSALAGRQSDTAAVHGHARRQPPGVGMLAGVADFSPDSLADLASLVIAHGPLFLMQPETPEAVPGVEILGRALGWQMVGEEVVDTPPPAFEVTPLGEPDAPEMLDLATLTKPGPFFAGTWKLGGFVGVKREGRLIAMAGERLKVDGFTEVSGVCTHPDHRGHGYAAGLMGCVAANIRARGETPILHTYASNAGAITLYERLGYRFRREVTVTSLAAPH